MICKNCGSSRISNEKFCTNCGTQFSSDLEQNVTEISNLNNNVFENVGVQPVEKQKKSMVMPIIVIAIILVVVVIAALLIMKFVVFSPKNVFFKGINEAYSNISDTFKASDEDKYKDKIISLNTDTTFNLDINKQLLTPDVKPIIDLLNDIKISLNETIDYKTKNFDLNFGLSNKEGSIVLEGNKRDNTMYLKLVDIYDKYISMPLEVTTTNTMNNDDMEYLIKELKDIFLDSLDKSKFKEEKVTLVLNNEDVETNKVSYEIDSIEAKRITEYIVNEINKDDKLLTILASVSDVSKEELKEIFDELSLEVDTTSTDAITMGVYTQGLLNEVIAYDFEVKSEETSIKLIISDYKDINEIRLNSNGMSMIHAVTKEIKENEYETIVTALTATAKINTVVSDAKSTMTIALDELSSGLDLDGNFEVTNNNDKGNLNMNLKLNVEKQEMFNLSTNTSYEILTDGTLKTIGTSVDMEKLTEDDFNKIMTNLQNNKFVVSVMSLLMGY